MASRPNIHAPGPTARWSSASGQQLAIDNALGDLDWCPEIGLEAGHRSSYEWSDAGGREQFEYDPSRDGALLANVGS